MGGQGSGRVSEITRETLERDRQRREKDQQRIADEYDAAADALVEVDGHKHRGAISHLRIQAMDWRRV